MSGTAKEMSTDLLKRLGMMGQGNRQDESGIGQRTVGVKCNMDTDGAAQVMASIGRSGSGFVFPKPLSPKPGALSTPSTRRQTRPFGVLGVNHQPCLLSVSAGMSSAV